MCSLIHVAHVVLCVLVLVGVRRVTVVIVHVGHDEVLVVIQFCVAIFVRDLLYQEIYSLHDAKDLTFSGTTRSRRHGCSVLTGHMRSVLDDLLWV